MITSNKKQEELFQTHIEAEKIKTSRTMCVLAALLYLVFIFADFYSISISLKQILLIRGGVILTLGIAFCLSYYKVFIRYYDKILAIGILISSAGIESMIYLASPEDHGSIAYFAGLILVIMTIFTWTYLKTETSILVTSIIILVYFYIEYQKQMMLSALLVNVLFLISAASIGFTSKLIRDRHVRENFILQQSLKQKVQEKTVEVKEQEYLANHDQLTGLKNGRYASEKLEEKLQYAKDSGKAMAIMYLDLNGFKQVNDIYGHKAGDEVLKIVAQRLQSCVRHRDCLARIGGDEFAIGLVVKKSELSIVDKLREKIEKMVVKPIGFEGNILQIGTSVGMASYPSSGNKINVLMAIADKRMYDAKQKKKMKTLVEEVDESSSKERVEPVIIFPRT